MWQFFKDYGRKIRVIKKSKEFLVSDRVIHVVWWHYLTKKC